jgi:hypothetical protein
MASYQLANIEKVRARLDDQERGCVDKDAY